MKRVQALVTGKKKPCTKLPTPAPTKGKKSPTSPRSPTDGAPRTSPTTPGSPLNPGVAQASPKPGDKQAGATGSLSSDSSTISASTSSLSTVSTASSIRGVSKIPASSPRKGSKDGLALAAQKSRIRQDVEERSKSKQKTDAASNKKSAKKDLKLIISDKTPASREPQSVRIGGHVAGSGDSGYVTKNVFAEDSKRAVVQNGKSAEKMSETSAEGKVKEAQGSSLNGSSGTSGQDNPGGQENTRGQDKTSGQDNSTGQDNTGGEDNTTRQDNTSGQGKTSKSLGDRSSTDWKMSSMDQQNKGQSQPPGQMQRGLPQNGYPQISQSQHGQSQHGQSQHGQSQNGQSKNGHADGLSGQSQPNHLTQSHPPLQGILKDTGSNGSAHRNYQDVDPYGSLPRDASYGHASRLPSRGGSSRGSSDVVYQGYGSLPRSTTPTPENPYSYGSLHRRPLAATSPQSGNYNGHTWGTLSRKADSDSGFAVGAMDKNPNYATIHYSNPTYGTTGHSSKTYAVINPSYQTSRPGSVPPPNTDAPDSLYGVTRPGSVPPQYYSDSDAGGYYRGARGGSVPLGYDSESGAYKEYSGRQGGRSRHYDTMDSGYSGSTPVSTLRVHPGDEQYRAGPGKRPIPRRHTVGAPGNQATTKNQETERKREAFMQLLAQRYPQYADKIQGAGGSQSPIPQHVDKPARSREVQRRRTAVVTYDPNQAGQTLEYDDLGTMSDLELPSFQRGGFMRTSMPIVRSASTSLERPLGLVFLVYGDQTKKSLLPNEITTLDTVRALFVRAFPNLTLDMLESPRKKIYILDPATNIYFQLEDLMEIKDRSVLKIHETDSDEPQKVKERQEVRGRTVQMPVSRSQSRPPYGDIPVGPPDFIKAHSLPPQSAHNYQELMQDQRNQWEIERRSRSRTPEPADRPRSLSAGATNRQRFSHSPDRLPTPERGPLNPIPENRQLTPGYQDQGNYYESVAAPGFRGPYPTGIYDVPVPYQGYPPPPPIPPQQTYVARSQRAAPMAHPQRAVAPGPDGRDGSRGGIANRHSLAFAPISAPITPEGGYQRSHSYRIPPTDRDSTELVRSHSVTPSDDTTRNRIEKMEQQLASLTAWVHYQKSDGTRVLVPPPQSVSSMSDSSDTFPASSASKHKGEKPPISTLATSTNHVARLKGLSDIPDGYQGSSGISSRESTPLSAQAEVTTKLAQLKSDLHILRRQQQLNMEAMRDEFTAAFIKIKKVLSTLPLAENQVNFHKRNELTLAKSSYKQDKEQVNKELSDLEASVEELRTDVISRQCRVNSSDVEGMALLLSNVTKSLADLKARFPEIHGQMKAVMDAEMRVVVSEEKFLKEEPSDIENSLKRCKKLTGTLYTLKRLASVQDHRPSQVPSLPQPTGEVITEQKTALLDNIKALVPNHEQRVQHIEAAEAARERKKKISTQQEALKFGKTLEIATKNLRPPSTTGDRISETTPASEVTSISQTAPSKPAVASKPMLPVTSAGTHTSTITGMAYTSTGTSSNIASVKPSFSVASSSTKPLDKPTATVSAMTSSVSDSVTTTATKSTTETSSAAPHVTKNVALPLTVTTGRLSSAGLGGTEKMKTETDDLKKADDKLKAGTEIGKKTDDNIKIGTGSPKKTDPSIYTYQVCGPVNPVIPVPPVFKPPKTTEGGEKGIYSLDKAKPCPAAEKPSDLAIEKSEPVKKVSVSFSESSPTIIPSSSMDSPVNGQKADLVSQRQAARSAFFSSLNSPPTSPTLGSPSRTSASLDPGPIVTPTGLVGKVLPGPTINLVLSGTASPKSPTSPGTFTITPPREIVYPAVELRKTSSSPLASPTRGIPRLISDNKSPVLDSSSDSSSSQTDAKKKVPPPPPPRKGSRPTSVGSSLQSQEMPRFVGGILGQHRLSGGPLSSTPKPIQKPLSRFENDLASGVYANMNRPDLQSQMTSAQQMITEAKSESDNSFDNPCSIPPPPSVTIPLEREERGSSSESTSSSSGTSMGSQQSVIARSASLSIKSAAIKPKPDPPRRQSSLLSKFTGGSDSKDSNTMNNGNSNLNGVDL